ncbi:hypothetical protein Taro_024593 [Colocasia esculenta]|uniref:UspA domain-containing protein n=1 Tax=Colocasia esculenta TaxID=4460 RepID=A0A843VE43_COLES|nr:hypothetical protein [Colocasia esculenta]
MVRTGTRLPSFCLNRVATRVRVRSPPSKRVSGAADGRQLLPPGHCLGESEKCDGAAAAAGIGKEAAAAGRRIMVVVDSGRESKCALQWALSHTVQAQDTVILLGVVARPPKQQQHCGGEAPGAVDPGSCEPLLSMKNLCQARKPGVQVEVSLLEAKERGPAIVEAARKQGAALLVLGQRKRSLTWRLVMLWAGGRVGGGGVVDYCIQNASCMAVAVRRRSRAAGGYLITTRRHKDFWLLA